MPIAYPSQGLPVDEHRCKLLLRVSAIGCGKGQGACARKGKHSPKCSWRKGSGRYAEPGVRGQCKGGCGLRLRQTLCRLWRRPRGTACLRCWCASTANSYLQLLFFTAVLSSGTANGSLHGRAFRAQDCHHTSRERSLFWLFPCLHITKCLTLDFRRAIACRARHG